MDPMPLLLGPVPRTAPAGPADPPWLDRLPLPAFVLDPANRLVASNLAFAELLGYQRDELRHLLLGSLIHPDDRALAPSSGRPGGPCCWRRRLLCVGGREVWCDLHQAAPANGVAVVQVVEIGAFLAERAEDRQAIDRLSQANLDLEQFALMVSHDLQEPLRQLTAQSRRLARRIHEGRDDQAIGLATQVITAAGRMQSLIDDLLVYARGHGCDDRFPTTDSFTALDLALLDLQMAIEESRAQVVRGALPLVAADHRQLVQVFQNLVANALKYRGEDAPLIEVGAEDCGDEWRFYVSDNGVGIASEDHERIFEVFQRAHRGSALGHGIGLALCRRIVTRHGGRIWVESTPSAGSTFLFTVPKRPLSTSPTPARSGSTPRLI